MACYSPLVSIIIPVYNGSKYLSEAIESALGQSYKNIEIIVVNDGSNDKGITEQVAQYYLPKIKYFSKPNGGVSSALNFGIKQATGEYVSWLSHDDLYYPEKIERQIYYLNRCGNKDVILYSDFEEIDHLGRHVTNHQMYKFEPCFFRVELLFNSFVHGCSLLIPKKYFSDDLLFNENLRTTQDYDLWFRMSEKYTFQHVSEIIIKSRRHAEQGSYFLKKRYLVEANSLYLKYMRRLSDSEIMHWKRHTRTEFYVNLALAFKKRGLSRPKWISLIKGARLFSGYYNEPKRDLLRKGLKILFSR